MAFADTNTSMRPVDNVIPFTQRGQQSAARPPRPSQRSPQMACVIADPHHPNLAGALTGTWGRGDVQTAAAAWHHPAMHCSWSDVRSLLRHPRRPPVPLVDLAVELSKSVNAVSRTEHLNGGALAHRDNVHAVALVRADIQSFA